MNGADSHRATILLTGGSGQVGWELRRTLAPLGNVIAPSPEELDLADANAIRDVVRRIQPALIVNPAAYTAVDRAESEPELCAAVNETAPRVLAEEAQRIGAPVVHYSTDYVFDGEQGTPYVETDTPNPVSVYGRTKLSGERALAESGVAHLVLRTSWVYSRRGNNFLLTMLRLAREREELRVVVDQVGAPTWARVLAEATAAAVARLTTSPERPGAGIAGVTGVYHLTAPDSTSWHAFAEAILAGDPARSEQRCRRVVPITTDEYPTPAHRPRNSRLDCTRARTVLGVALPSWREQLALAMDPG